MESFRHLQSPAPNRFLGVLSRPVANGGSGLELHEDEVLWDGSDPVDAIRSPRSPSSAMPTDQNPSHGLSPFRRIPEKNSGILAALPEDEQKRVHASAAPFVQRKPSISPSSASTSPSSASSARMIPMIPKIKADYGGGKGFQQSAPVNIPMIPRMARHKPEVNGGGIRERDEMDGDEDEMLPPHEIIARRSGVESPMTTFSVLEGVGRTLKGRDLRRVRNAVWRKTGFLD